MPSWHEYFIFIRQVAASVNSIIQQSLAHISETTEPNCTKVYTNVVDRKENQWTKIDLVIVTAGAEMADQNLTSWMAYISRTV